MKMSEWRWKMMKSKANKKVFINIGLEQGMKAWSLFYVISRSEKIWKNIQKNLLSGQWIVCSCNKCWNYELISSLKSLKFGLKWYFSSSECRHRIIMQIFSVSPSLWVMYMHTFQIQAWLCLRMYLPEWDKTLLDLQCLRTRNVLKRAAVSIFGAFCRKKFHFALLFRFVIEK